MHLLKPTTLPIPRGRKMPLIPTPPLHFAILKNHIRHLKHPHRHRVPAVLPQRLQQPGQQTRAHDLVLGCLGILQTHTAAIVGLAEPSVVFVVGAEDQRHDLRPARHGGFQADDVGEFVEGEGSRDAVGGSWEVAREVVEAVGDGDVFHYVRFVEDVGARDGDAYVEGVRISFGGDGGVAHFLQEGAQRLAGLVEAADGVEVGGGGLGGARGEVGGLAGLAVVGAYDVDGFDGEGVVAVAAEHGDEDVVDDFQLRLVGGGDVDEDVAGGEGDFAVVAVDDGRHGEDGAVFVVDDGVDGGVADDVQVAGEVLVFFVHFHHLRCVHLLRRVEGCEDYLFWWECLV